MNGSIGQTRKYALAAALAASVAVCGPALADASGTYTRSNGDKVQVSQSGGRLYCKIIKNGFEMCHGMAKTGGGTWKGGNMKHPDMPSVMTFNGTVTDAGSNLHIKGCAIGESMCDAETWTRAK